MRRLVHRPSLPLVFDHWHKMECTCYQPTMYYLPTHFFSQKLLLSAARLGNSDVAPGGDITGWYLAAALQSRPWECQMYVTVLAPPHKFGTCDLHLLLGVSKYQSKYVSD